jgi:hypothetical protein
MTINFRALCSELLQELCCHYRSWELKEGHCSDAIKRARAALAAEPAGEGPSERIISIAKAVQEHAFGWEPDARLIGNVCAEDVADLCGAILAHRSRPATPPAPEVGEVEG